MAFRTVFILTLLTGSLFGQKNVLVEIYTSALCGACPSGHLEAAAIAENYPNVVLAFHHSSVDGMANEHSTEWKQFYDVPFAPGAAIDRIPHFGDSPILPLSEWESKVEEQLSEPAYVNLQLSGDYDTWTRELILDVDLIFDEEPPAGELRLNMMILEDSVIGTGYGFDQNNYYDEVADHPLYGLGHPIPSYPHRNVIRDIAENTWGTTGVFPENEVLNTPYSHTYHYQMSPAWDYQFVKLVVFVSLVEDENLKHQRILNVTQASLSDFFTTSTTSLKEDEVSELSAYPNPASKLLRVQLPGQTTHISLVDASGSMAFQRAWNLSDSSFELAVDHLVPGIYFLRTKSASGTQSIPVIIAP